MYTQSLKKLIKFIQLMSPVITNDQARVGGLKVSNPPPLLYYMNCLPNVSINQKNIDVTMNILDSNLKSIETASLGNLQYNLTFI